MIHYLFFLISFFLKIGIVIKNHFSKNKVLIKGLFIGKISFKGFYNSVYLNGKNSKLKIRIVGNNNNVLIEEGFISNCSINIEGNNNNFILKKNRGIANSKFLILDFCNQIFIDDNTGIGGARFVVAGKSNYISIGKNNMISDNVEIWATDSHSIIDKESFKRINPDLPINIHDNVWICSGCYILKGVTIKENSIIGMGSVVVNDVPENSVSAGNPNKILKSNVSWLINRI